MDAVMLTEATRIPSVPVAPQSASMPARGFADLLAGLVDGGPQLPASLQADAVPLDPATIGSPAPQRDEGPVMAAPAPGRIARDARKIDNQAEAEPVIEPDASAAHPDCQAAPVLPASPRQIAAGQIAMGQPAPNRRPERHAVKDRPDDNAAIPDTTIPVQPLAIPAHPEPQADAEPKTAKSAASPQARSRQAGPALPTLGAVGSPYMLEAPDTSGVLSRNRTTAPADPAFNIAVQAAAAPGPLESKVAAHGVPAMDGRQHAGPGFVRAVQDDTVALPAATDDPEAPAQADKIPVTSGPATYHADDGRRVPADVEPHTPIPITSGETVAVLATHIPEASPTSSGAMPALRTERAGPVVAERPDTNEASPTAQVAGAVRFLARNKDGPQTLILRLDPEELGRIEISVTQSRDGPAAITMQVERPETLLMMIRDQGQLHRALDNAGIAPESRQLTFQLAAQPSDASGANWQSGFGQPGGQAGWGHGGRPDPGRPDPGSPGPGSTQSTDAEAAIRTSRPGNPRSPAQPGVDITA